MPVIKSQPIAGVSSKDESIIQLFYPTVASSAIGRLLGKLYNCIPVKICGIKLSVLLFALPTAPLAAIGYLQIKILTRRYILTNRNLQVCHSLGYEARKEVALQDIGEITVTQQDGQEFHKAGDVNLLTSSGQNLLTMEGIAHPESCRRAILRARDAQRSVAASLSAINAR